MTPGTVQNYTQLVKPQADLLAKVRDAIGPLVGASLSVRKGKGWHINLSFLREISEEEREAVSQILLEFDVPVVINEHRNPSRIAASRNVGEYKGDTTHHR